MAETNPTISEDIVLISQTKGTPKNFGKIHDHTVTVTRSSGKITQIDETKNSVLRRRIILTRTAGIVTSINVKLYQLNGTTIEREYTDTLTRTDGVLTSIARTVTT